MHRRLRLGTFAFMTALTALAGCAPDAPPVAAARASINTAIGERPLVVMLTQMPGPTAPPERQWLPEVTASPGLAIPDNFTSGASSDITMTDFNGGSCSGIYDIEVVLRINHPQPSDLFITLSAINPNGSTRKSITLFDGPGLQG